MEQLQASEASPLQEQAGLDELNNQIRVLRDQIHGADGISRTDEEVKELVRIRQELYLKRYELTTGHLPPSCMEGSPDAG